MQSQNYEHLMNIYHDIYVYCGISAIILLALTIILFVIFNIPRVFNELTGRGAKKAVEAMAEASVLTGNLISQTVGEDGRRQRRRSKTGALSTARLRKRTAPMTDYLMTEKMETNSVDTEPPTDILKPHTVSSKSVVKDFNEEIIAEITVFNNKKSAVDFVTCRSIIEIHTDEVI